MASLSTINDDVIREIGMCLLHEKSALCALALTHRNFHNVARKLLVRNIEVWVQGSFDVGIERYHQLICTLESQPDLGANTRSLGLRWGWDTQWHDTDKDAANERANRLLSLTPKIRSLDIQNYSHICSPFAPPRHLLLNLDLLKEITTSDPKSTVHEVTQLMQVPNLQTLDVQFMNVWMMPTVQSTTDSETRIQATHLTQLKLAPDSHLNPSAVHSLLTITSNIKSLSVNLPGLQSQEASMRGRRRHVARMLENLSPAGVLICLRPVRETLVELDLNDVGVRWPGHDGSRLDLRGFTSMKKISLCAVCVFVPDGSWDGRKGLGELLPKTIEEFVIDFDFLLGFLYHTTEIPSLFHGETDVASALSSIPPERYSWLTELIAHPASVPELRYLLVKERLKGSHGVSFESAMWEPPTILKAQFESRSWEVKVWVRVPDRSNVSGWPRG